MSGKPKMQQLRDYHTSETDVTPTENAAAAYEILKRGSGAADIDELGDELGVDWLAARQWAREILCGGFTCCACGRDLPA